ncbi:apelin receptor B-like [Hemicordylus capensis]|uniref:apelin receptor B-like n=1 Tax=Hemicordylus capensis TaxID=884348 RepID=UPI00230290FE|nr:apelin receptor B-like [Hemicordylus capensis]
MTGGCRGEGAPLALLGSSGSPSGWKAASPPSENAPPTGGEARGGLLLCPAWGETPPRSLRAQPASRGAAAAAAAVGEGRLFSPSRVAQPAADAMARQQHQQPEYAPTAGPAAYYDDYEAGGPAGANWSGWAPACAWGEEEGGGGGGAETDWEVSFSLLPVLYMLVFVLGLSGNGLVLATVWRGGPRAKRRASDTYIGHLALADLAFVATLPLWAAYTALRFHWPFGAALCKLSSYAVLLNMFASAFCLACLSVERYLAIVRALPRSSAGRPAPARTRASTRLALAAVWLLAGLLALPALLLRDTRPAGEEQEEQEAAGEAPLRCDMDFSGVASGEAEQARWLLALSVSTTALGFALPLLLMSLCYCGIGATLRRHFRRHARPTHEEGRCQRRRLLRIIVALVAVFAACWLPHHLLKLLDVLDWVGVVRLPCAAQALILRLHPYATCLAYVNSCLNPFLYAFFDSRFRARCLGWRKALLLRGQAGSVSSTLSGQTQKSEVPSLGTKV